jgi:chromosome segregation ATPase
MSRAYQKNVKLAGIIYLHRISDNRLAGSALKNLRIFKCLCGENAFKHVMLVTSMWDTVKTAKDEALAVERETQLVNDDGFWKDMYQRGSLVARWAGSAESAKEMVEDILATRDRHGSATLQIQKELVDDEKDLDQTTAGRELYKEFEELQMKFEERLNDVLEQTKEAILKKDSEWREELQEEKLKLEEQMRKAEQSQRALQVDLKKLMAETEEKYRVQQERLVEELRATNENIARSDGVYKQLQRENREKDEELKARLAEGAKTAREKEDLEEKIAEMEEAKKREDELRQELEKKKQRKKTVKRILKAIPSILIPIGSITLSLLGVGPFGF